MFGRMKTINFTEESLNNLKFMEIGEACYNSEAHIYLYNEFVIKKYMNVSWYGFSLENRKKTIKFLNNNRRILENELSELVLPEFYVTYHRKFAGFGMLKISGRPLIELLKDERVEIKDKIDALIKVGEFLEKLDEVRKKEQILRDFYMNDLHSGNVMIKSDGMIKFIDVDGVQVSKDIDTRALYLTQPFFSKMRELEKYEVDEETYRFKPSRETVLYCYNMMILELFVGKNISKIKYDYYMEYLDKLDSKNLDGDLLDSFKRVYDTRENINPCHILKKVRNFTEFELQKCDKKF